jgi:hypothetical protein
MPLSIGHREKEMTIIDVVREIPAPFDPEGATEEFANGLKADGLQNVTGDRYAGQWCARRSKSAGSPAVIRKCRSSASTRICCRTSTRKRFGWSTNRD